MNSQLLDAYAPVAGQDAIHQLRLLSRTLQGKRVVHLNSTREGGGVAEILRMLIDHRGEVVSRQDLLRKVWGYVHLPTTRTVDNHIARLRKKLELDPAESGELAERHPQDVLGLLLGERERFAHEPGPGGEV